jgi:hypothetical protein
VPAAPPAPAVDTDISAELTKAIGYIDQLIKTTTDLKGALTKGLTTTDPYRAALMASKDAESKRIKAQLEYINVLLTQDSTVEAKGAAKEAAATAANGVDGKIKAAEEAAEAEAVIGGGLKPAKKASGKSKRAQKGGADEAVAPSSVVSPAVYNIQGMLTQTHNPYLVASDANIAAMSRIHAPFSAGVVGDMNQQTTTELPTALINRMTPGPPMSGGAAKRKSGATKKK